jgi:hypothetical protein
VILLNIPLSYCSYFEHKIYPVSVTYVNMRVFYGWYFFHIKNKLKKKVLFLVNRIVFFFRKQIDNKNGQEKEEAVLRECGKEGEVRVQQEAVREHAWFPHHCQQ